MFEKDSISLYRSYELTGEIREKMCRTRAVGRFFVHVGGLGSRFGTGYWQVGNPADVPVEPCIRCDLKSGIAQARRQTDFCSRLS